MLLCSFLFSLPLLPPPRFVTKRGHAHADHVGLQPSDSVSVGGARVWSLCVPLTSLQPPLPPLLSSPLRFLAPSSILVLARYASPKLIRFFFRSFDISPLIQITHMLLHIIALHYFIHYLLYMIIYEYVSIIDPSSRKKRYEMASMVHYSTIALIKDAPPTLLCSV